MIQRQFFFKTQTTHARKKNIVLRMLNSKSNNIGNDGPVNTTFSLGSYNANAYKQFRPDYAPSLFNHILQYVKKSNTATQNTLAVDVGCGKNNQNGLSPRYFHSHHYCISIHIYTHTYYTALILLGTGQATLALSPFFTNVIGLDPSAPMLSSASSSTSETHNNVSFAVGTCSAFPASISPASCTLVTAAQAAHWFDLPAFYNEAYRVLVPGGCIALFGYGYARVQGFNDISDRIERLGRFDLKAYWDERRGLVDEHYVDPSFTPPNPLFTDVSR